MNKEKESFWKSLFDFEFKEFITIRLAGLIYMMAIVLISLFTLAFIVDGFSISFLAGILYLLISPIIFLILVTGTRVWLEITVVIFDIARNLEKVEETLRQMKTDNREDTDIPINQE